jgi:hypothetical protein
VNVGGAGGENVQCLGVDKHERRRRVIL